MDFSLMPHLASVVHARERFAQQGESVVNPSEGAIGIGKEHQIVRPAQGGSCSPKGRQSLMQLRKAVFTVLLRNAYPPAQRYAPCPIIGKPMFSAQGHRGFRLLRDCVVLPA